MSNNKIPILVTGLMLLVSLVVLFFLIFQGVGRPQNATPSKAAETDPNKCQGNPNASAKCFKCDTGTNKNNPIGVLDLSCFLKFYGQTVGKP